MRLFSSVTLLLVLLFASLSIRDCVSAQGPSLAERRDGEQFDHCIIGAGPGGVQLGFFLQQSHRNYVILERSAVAASFFDKYPRHRNLISINKKSTPRHGQHADFRLRHDWNSLLSTQANVGSIEDDAHINARTHPPLLLSLIHI